MSDAAEAQGAPEADATEAVETDYSPVIDRVGQLMDERIGSLRDDILGRFPEPEPEAEPDPWAALLGEPEDVEPEPQLDVNALREALRAEMANELGPLQAELQQLRTSQDLNGLLEEYPDLKDPDVRRETGQAAREAAESIFGPEHAAALTNSPAFIALVHQARSGQQHAAGEVPATGDTTQLEGGGGAAPGGIEQPNIVAQVMQARRGLPKGFR